MKRWRAVLVGAAVAAAPAAAQATPVDALFRDFGLFGTWATECAAPASPSNPHVRITAQLSGDVLEDHNLGADYAVNHYRFVSAERISADQLSTRVIFQPGSEGEEQQTLVFRVRKNTRRTMFNQPDGGPVRVKDGIVLARASKTPTLMKCD